jgi:HEAT repeats
MRRHKLLVALVSSAALAVALSIPGVHWRLYGWSRGEAFWHGRPTSYWRGEVTASEVFLPDCGVGQEGVPLALRVHFYRPEARPLEAVRNRVCRLLGSPLQMATALRPPLPDTDASAVPVLRELLSDPEPKVRYCAVVELARLGEAARPATTDLARLRADVGRVVQPCTVGDAAAEALRRIDLNSAPHNGRP